jgi:hypothetical protein
MNTDLLWVIGSLTPFIIGFGVPLLGHLILSGFKRIEKGGD